jgi:hypothetical protein
VVSMKFDVTFEVWRESFGGRDQCDGKETVMVEATNEDFACKKAVAKRLNPGKGKQWSQSIWVKNVTAVRV